MFVSSHDNIPRGPPLTGPLDSIPTKSRLPVPTKTPFAQWIPDVKADRPPLKEVSTTKGDKKLRPGHSAPPANVKFPSPTDAVRPSRLPTAGVSHITRASICPSSLPGRIGVQTSQSEEEASAHCDGLLVFLIILLLLGVFSGCLLLVQCAGSLLRRIGRRFGWKWVKRSDSVDLENAIYHLKDHQGAFEEHHLVLLREVLADYGNSSYARAGEKAAEEGRLDSTYCSSLSEPRPARMAPEHSFHCS
ncbi:uncharacterized protein FMAN_10161 [Fusarium mangiferae]|uniref:Uncharacterized protein n=1 Tax=Fusarium mangiferae TaxID=192010 RepID=A0A1L7TQL4_FUSMA|nr:uncharacterized protein FMAN_10161 [Fusarium mangiferae]CVL00894.1 uncharacterized protein FMAN_10161 [Fusarium mangiferae]